MAWFLGSRRGPEWKHGWSRQTLSSISLPPFPLLAIFAILVFLLSLSHYMEYKTQLEQTMISFQLLLVLVPILSVFVILSMSSGSWFVFRLPRLAPGAVHRGGGCPWGVAVLLVALLVMISYESSFRSKWFRPLWRSD